MRVDQSKMCQRIVAEVQGARSILTRIVTEVEPAEDFFSSADPELESDGVGSERNRADRATAALALFGDTIWFWNCFWRGVADVALVDLPVETVSLGASAAIFGILIECMMGSI